MGLWKGWNMAWLEPDICDIDIHVVRWDVYSTGRQHAEYVMGIYQLYIYMQLCV